MGKRAQWFPLLLIIVSESLRESFRSEIQSERSSEISEYSHVAKTFYKVSVAKCLRNT